MNRKFTLAVIALALAVFVPMFCFAASAKSAPLTYTASVSPSGDGEIYWDYGKNMEFFLAAGKDNYNQSCRVQKGTDYRFSTLMTRGLIARPGDGSYFEGFYDQSGRKLSLKQVNMDIVRVKADDIYYYDYVVSMNNSVYTGYTEKKYQSEVKAYLKAIYGTSRYTVCDRVILYEVPKKNMVICPRFHKKTAPDFHCAESFQKTIGDRDFYLVNNLPKALNANFRSSSSKLLTVGTSSGLACIKGEGIAYVTMRIPETEKTLSAEYKIKITIRPDRVTLTDARRTDAKHVTVKWKPDAKSSGCEIQISPDKNFSAISAKKTAASGKITSTKITVSKNAVCSYVRIRPYKRSRGEKLYGNFEVMKIK